MEIYIRFLDAHTVVRRCFSGDPPRTETSHRAAPPIHCRHRSVGVSGAEKTKTDDEQVIIIFIFRELQYVF